MNDDQEDTMREKTKTAAAATVQERGEAVLEARAVLAQWEARTQAAAGELEELQGRLGTAALQSPEVAEGLPRALQDLQGQLVVAERAVQAQRAKVSGLEQAYLVAVADLIEARDLVPARAEYDTHAALMAKAVRQVEELEGVEGAFVPAYLEKVRALTAGESGSFTVPRSEALMGAVRVAERQVALVRDLAAGGNPTPAALVNGSAEDFPPEVWGPDALVPASSYLASVDGARRTLEEALRELQALPQEYDRLVERARRTAEEVPPAEVWIASREANLRAGVDAARERLAELGDTDRAEAAA